MKKKDKAEARRLLARIDARLAVIQTEDMPNWNDLLDVFRLWLGVKK